MDINVHKTPFEFVEINNTYTNLELQAIWQELDFLFGKPVYVTPELSGAAKSAEGEVLRKNRAVMLDTVYTNRDTSNILKLNRKLYSASFPLEELSPIFNAIHTTDKDYTNIQYYENSDYYKPHTDSSVLTCVTYFYKEPKAFSGGELFFPRYKTVLEPKYNTTYIFPGPILHGVKAIDIQESLRGKGFGRYCVTNFLNFQ